MKQCAILLRGLQLYSHAAHNLAKGSTFLQDHEFLGELYPAYEEAYDSVVERMIGLDGDADIAGITQEACKMAMGKNPSDTEAAFGVILAAEKALCKEIDEYIGKYSQGTQNLLQGIADDSEMRQYKISRRLK